MFDLHALTRLTSMMGQKKANGAPTNSHAGPKERYVAETGGAKSGSPLTTKEGRIGWRILAVSQADGAVLANMGD